MVLRDTALEHNIALLARYCEVHGVWLAPHAKTPMAPQLVARQLDAGAWGVSVATVSQARVFRAFGVRRILIANEVVQPLAVRWLAAELAGDPDLDVYCLVDSLIGVAAMTEAAGAVTRPIPVLIELGVTGGRTGCRSFKEAEQVADAVARSPALELVGVEGYEGSLKTDDMAQTITTVDDYLNRLRSLTIELAQRGAFPTRREIIVSAGGSGLFDRVVEKLAPRWNLDHPVRVVIRPGSYIAHDSGEAEHISPLGGRSTSGDRLRAALEVWGAVLSRPEPGLAIVGFGKRDVSHDLGLPMPHLVAREGVLRSVGGIMAIVGLDDQHAYVTLPPNDELAVGDFLGSEISHPCTAFDKWRLVPVGRRSIHRNRRSPHILLAGALLGFNTAFRNGCRALRMRASTVVLQPRRMSMATNRDLD